MCTTDAFDLENLRRGRLCFSIPVCALNVYSKYVQVLTFSLPNSLCSYCNPVLQECGVALEDFNDFQEGDVMQCYTLDEIERKL